MLSLPVQRVWMLLRITFGITTIITGIDKFFNILVDWQMYLSPIIADALPISLPSFMMGIGVIEIIAGLLLLTHWPRFGAYLISAWLVLAALNLISTGQMYDIAVRDLVMAIAAFGVAKLTEANEGTLNQAAKAPALKRSSQR